MPYVEFHGGRFLRHPEVHTVTFTEDDPSVVKRLERFGDRLTTSDWWRTAVAGYCDERGRCIGDGRPGRHVRLPDQLPSNVSTFDVEGLLVRAATAGRFGELHDDALIVIYLPPGVALRDAQVPRYCDGPRAVHRTLALDGAVVPYALIPRCGDEDLLTVSASHEILEATTNPEPADRGFAFRQDADTFGFTSAGVEPADPCSLLHQNQGWPTEDGFAVHRVWSNRAASLGTDPCVPAPAERPFLALLPRQATVRLTDPGATATVVLDGATDRPTTAWSITAYDVTGRHEGQAYLDVELDRHTMAPGGSATLRLTLLRPRRAGPIVVLLVSTAGGYSYAWPLAVSTR